VNVFFLIPAHLDEGPLNGRCCQSIIRPHRSTTYVDAAYCYQPSNVVSLSVTLMSPAKTAEPIEMPFGLRTQLDPGNHVLDGSPQVLRDVAMATSLGRNLP